MLQRIDRHNARQPPGQKIRVSVEVEKPREELFQLFGYGDVVSGPRSVPLPHPANLGLKGSQVFPCSGMAWCRWQAGGKEAGPQLRTPVQARRCESSQGRATTAGLGAPCVGGSTLRGCTSSLGLLSLSFCQMKE